MPIDTLTIQDALNAPHPARAFAVALVAFYGLTARQITKIMVTDIRDGRLVLEDRTIPCVGAEHLPLGKHARGRNPVAGDHVQ